MPRIFPSVLPACATFALLTLAPPLPAQETASDTAAHPAAEEAADRPGMAEVEQAWARGDFVFVRDGLKALAEETGTPLAQYRYGRVLIEGRGGPRDIKAAVGWLEKAVAQNHADAATLLAQVLLAEGLDTVPRDPARAADLLGSAATRGDPNAQVMLARLLTAGDGVTPDPQAAFDWYLAAAEQGHLEAQFAVARSYLRGDSQTANVEQGLHWLEQAAEGGHVQAQYFLAGAYDRGTGVEASPAEARRWYRRAAEQGCQHGDRPPVRRYGRQTVCPGQLDDPHAPGHGRRPGSGVGHRDSRPRDHPAPGQDTADILLPHGPALRQDSQGHR